MDLKVLLLENVHASALANFKEAGIAVELKKTALSEEELLRTLPDYNVVGLRSKTRLTERVLKANPHLIAVGAFCIGTNQIDLQRANALGLPVFNAPYSNTRSVAEMVIAEIVMLSRRLGDVNSAAHQGTWLKSAVGNYEIRGKTLGIVGYGHIGSQVSVLAESMGLSVLYYDIVKKLPLGNAKPVESLEELLASSDFVTFHVPETPLTMNMMGAAQIAAMKASAYLINASRGTVVDIPALAAALKEDRLSGAAVDVFPAEPENNQQHFMSELQGLKNVILTPHIGGSTEEAQESIGREVSTSLIQYLKEGSTHGAVNFPNVDVPPLQSSARLLNVHRNVPGVLSRINGIVSQTKANIRAQYLSTDSNIGYLVMDIENADVTTISREIGALETSIKTRVLS